VDHFIDSIDIQNFKSIRQLHIAGLNRINLLIGRPNVGKSNILEALGLFSLTYERDIRNLIRLENPLEIFFDGETSIPCVISVSIPDSVDVLNVYKIT
jgi:AAA15 family ATPase/GTPase